MSVEKATNYLRYEAYLPINLGPTENDEILQLRLSHKNTTVAVIALAAAAVI